MSVPEKSARVSQADGATAPSPEHYEDPVLLEQDEDVAPRPEEEIADLLRADPDRNPGT